MTRKILIIEDNEIHMHLIKNIIEKLNKDITILCVTNGHDAYTIAMEQHIHLFLLDIILNANDTGDVGGLQFVKEIRNVKKYAFVPVIFITCLEDPNLYSYSKLNCLGYIEKPFDENQVKEYVLKGLEFPIADETNKSVFFRKDGIIYSKQINEIIYIESSRRKKTIYCVDEKLEIPYKSSKQIMDELDSDMFIQCSRYIIVNRNFIKRIDYTNRFITLKGVDKQLEIGVTMKKNFRSKLDNEFICD